MSNIKPGDLVMVVKPVGCGCTKSYTNVGKIFTVTKIFESNGKCAYCLKFHGDKISARNKDGLIQLSRLIKIDPPPISEDTTEDLKLHEPA